MHIVPPAALLPGTHSIDVWPLRSVHDSIVPNWKYPDVKYSPSTMSCLSLRVFRWDACHLSSRILVRESGNKAHFHSVRGVLWEVRAIISQSNGELWLENTMQWCMGDEFTGEWGSYSRGLSWASDVNIQISQIGWCPHDFTWDLSILARSSPCAGLTSRQFPLSRTTPYWDAWVNCGKLSTSKIPTPMNKCLSWTQFLEHFLGTRHRAEIWACIISFNFSPL